MHLKYRKKANKFEQYRLIKDKEMTLLVEKTLEGAENSLNLFFEFESAITELVRLTKISKSISKEALVLEKDIRIQIDKLLKLKDNGNNGLH